MLSAPAKFFDDLRTGLLGPALSTSEVSGCEAILDACEGLPLPWTAYALATAYLETAHTMQPVKEMGGDAYFTRMYDIKGLRPEVAKRLGNTQPGDGALFCGRGYVQLTGRTNYARASAELGLGASLLAHPDMALDPETAANVMRHGMVEGWFTGRSFKSYLPSAGAATREQFTSARAIINGNDRADDIAGFALQFQRALQDGGWA